MNSQNIFQQDTKLRKYFLIKNNSFRHGFVFLPWIIAVFLLASCQTAPTSTPVSTETVTLTPTATATATSTPTPNPTITLTPEPAWYQPIDGSMGVLKYNYAEVVNDRAKIYASFQDAVGETGNFGYLPNFPAYVAYTTSRTGDDGHDYYLVNYGWMDGSDLLPLTPPTFTGILLTREVPFRFGWVLAGTQSINATGMPIQTYSRYQIIHDVPALSENPGFVAVGADEWLPDDSVAMVNPGVPADAGEGTCRFVYVDLAEQTLSVYDNCKLVFVTLISSGQNSWTFEGRFAIQYKVEYSSIRPPAESTSEYYIEGVPYFMTYSGDFGFHGAYWHDAFGTAASHGCINLSPADAKWLYDWAWMGERVIISAGE